MALRTWAVCILGILFFAGLSGCLQGTKPPARLPVSVSTGLVSTVHPLASQAGADMLRRGGNFVDAAAAVQWALNMVEPSMSGLGGGSLILLWFNETKRFVFIDGREMAPAASTPDQFMLPGGQPMDPAVAQTRGYAVGVPGTLKAFSYAIEKYGRLNLSDTLDPAIKIASGGFTVDNYLASYIASSDTKLKSWPASAKLYFPGAVCPPDAADPVSSQGGCVGGTALKAGDTFKNPDLAKTFRLLQGKGIDAFYQGDIGAALVAAQAKRQGRMTTADLEKYSTKERDVLSVDYRGYRVVSVPPPSAGGLTMLEMLNILSGYNLTSKGENSVDALHLMIEAMHLAYQDRYAYIGDTDFVKVPMRGLLDPAFATERRALIDPAKANAAPKAGDPWKYENASRPSGSTAASNVEGDHTTHFTVVDNDGNVATVTTTLESLFGTGILVPGYGFLLNNQLTDFDHKPGGPNQVEPGKRPRSSMAPTIVLQGDEAVLALGSPGGPTITTTVMQVLLNAIVFGMPLDAAVKAPRIFSSDYPKVSWEEGLAQGVRDGLNARGHTPDDAPGRIGNVQAAGRPLGHAWMGVADTRGGQGSVEYVLPPSVP